jgi:hypothetical protein
MNNLNKFKDQLIAILSAGRTFAIGYHPDADGFASAAILIKYLLSNGVAREHIDLYPANTNERVLEPNQEIEVAAKLPDVLAYLDLCGHDREQIRRLKKKIRYVVSIDHHRFEKEWPGLFDLYINSMLFEELTRPELQTSSKLLNALFYNSKNDWLEILGLEGDNVVPTLPGTLSYQVSQLLNKIGEIERSDEDPAVRMERRNTMLNCLLRSENLLDFGRHFEGEKELYNLYLSVIADVDSSVEDLKSLEPVLEFHANKIFVYHITATTGFEIMNQVLKGHLPFLGYNSTYILHQEMQTGGMHQIFLYTSNPWVNCYEIATKRTGGGHPNRAGFRVEGQRIEVAVEEVIETVKEMIVKGEAEYSSH